MISFSHLLMKTISIKTGISMSCAILNGQISTLIELNSEPAVRICRYSQFQLTYCFSSGSISPGRAFSYFSAVFPPVSISRRHISLINRLLISAVGKPRLSNLLSTFEQCLWEKGRQSCLNSWWILLFR